MIPRETLSAVTSEDRDLGVNAAARIGVTLHGKYRIDRVLGVGGMGVVYAATHRNGKRFAIKLLHAEFSSRRDIRNRFLREGYVANAVDHPGVVAVLDDDVAEDGSAFLVMELLDGNTVDALGARPGSRMPLREALGIAHQLLDVLDAAHTKSIIHRDIKPANLFVLKDGQVKVLDFGLARLRDATTSLETTRTGEQMGTPAFMAPEQARGDVKHIDARTDIWAAGATLFTALSGCIVHEGANARQVMVRAATIPARSLSSLIPDAPASVVDLLAKALEYDMDARWNSAAAMRDAIAAAHEELFGPLLRDHLRTLFDSNQECSETAPTERVPGSNSIPMLRDSAVVSTSTSTNPDEHPKPTNLGRADSTPERAESLRSGRRVLAAAGLVTVLVAGTSVALYTRHARNADVAAPHSSLGRRSHRRSSDDIITTDSPALPSPTATETQSAVPVSPQSSSAKLSHSSQRTATKPLGSSAPKNLPLPKSSALPAAVASSVHSDVSASDKPAPSGLTNPVDDSRRRRRIDDPIDHQ